VGPVLDDGDDVDVRLERELEAQVLADRRMVLGKEDPDLPAQVGRSIRR
jgi:hypothetical protein